MATERGHSDGTTGLKKTVTLVNKYGIHVRTAALISDITETYESDIIITSPSASSDARDMMRLLLLQAGHGTELEISVTGCDAQAALTAICTLIENGFELDDEKVSDS